MANNGWTLHEWPKLPTRWGGLLVRITRKSQQAPRGYGFAHVEEFPWRGRVFAPVPLNYVIRALFKWRTEWRWAPYQFALERGWLVAPHEDCYYRECRLRWSKAGRAMLRGAR